MRNKKILSLANNCSFQMEEDHPMEEGEIAPYSEGEQIANSSSASDRESDPSHSWIQQNIAGDFNRGFNLSSGHYQNPNTNSDHYLGLNPTYPNLERNQNSSPNTDHYNSANEAYHHPNLHRNGNSSASHVNYPNFPAGNLDHNLNVNLDHHPRLNSAYNPNQNPTPIPNRKTNRVDKFPISFVTFTQPNMEPSSTRQQQEFHEFISAGPGMTDPILTNKDRESGPSHSGTKRSISEVSNPSFNPAHYQYSKPNPDHNLGSNLFNPNLTRTQNPNLSVEHYANVNQAYHPNLQSNQNPNLSDSNCPNYRDGHGDTVNFLSPGFNPPQCSNQLMATVRSRLPPPPPRRVPDLVEKMKKSLEYINSFILSSEPVVVPDKSGPPGATKVVLMQVKKCQDGGSTSNGFQTGSLGRPMTISYGDYHQVVQNVHPDKVRQFLSSVQEPGQPMQYSTKMPANSAQVPDTALKLNVGPSGVINVDDWCNSREASPGKATVNASNSQPAKTASDNDGNWDQRVQPFQIDSVNNQNGEHLQTKTNDDQYVCGSKQQK